MRCGVWPTCDPGLGVERCVWPELHVAWYTSFMCYTFVLLTCILLPLTLTITAIAGMVMRWDKKHREIKCINAGCKAVDFVMRIVPMSDFKVVRKGSKEPDDYTGPRVWVCNHISMLDVFYLMSTYSRSHLNLTSNPHTPPRPVKILYWRGLESNPVTKLMFRLSGFIPVDMAANESGETNIYDKSTFRNVIVSIRRALKQGFDVGILPEGQLNPNPSSGVLEVYNGAWNIAKMGKGKVYGVGIYGDRKSVV